MSDKNADHRNAVMKAEAAVVDADNDLKLTPEWHAHQSAAVAMMATDAHAIMLERRDALDELHDEGGEPIGRCEGCGVPFFDGDECAWDSEGVYSCREGGPCFAPPEDGINPICTGCNKRPNEIMEYIEIAAEEEVTPNEYVKSDEGTYNHENGHFLCTGCYVAAGMPSTDGGWVAP